MAIMFIIYTTNSSGNNFGQIYDYAPVDVPFVSMKNKIFYNFKSRNWVRAKWRRGQITLVKPQSVRAP